MLKRLFVMLLLLTLAMVGFVPVTAQSVDTDHAEFAPADTLFFATLRTDDGYIDTLDALALDVLIQVQAAIPPELLAQAGLPETTAPLRDALDAAGFELAGADFDTVFRSWLGDSASIAVSVPDPMGDPEVLIVVDITNAQATENFMLEQIIEDDIDLYERTEENGFVVYRSTDESIDTYTAIGEELLFITSVDDMLPLDGPLSDNLTGQAQFTATLDTMPADSYNILAYLDANTAARLSLNLATGEEPSAETTETLENLGGAAIGATILDGRSLTIDAIGEVGTLLPAVGAIDPAFLSTLPAETDFLILGNDLRSAYESGIGGLNDLAAAGALDDTNPEDVDTLLQQLDGLLQMVIGVSFSEGVIDWMDGEYAIYTSYAIPEPGAPSLATIGLEAFSAEPQPITVGLEAGIVIETSDPAATAELVGSLAPVLQQQGIPAVPVTIGESESILITLEDPSLDAPFELVISSNDSVFVAGTRTSAEAALNASGGFDGNATYAAANFLPNANTVLYAEGEATIVLAGDGLAAFIGLGPAIGNVFNDIIGGLGGEPTEPTAPTPEEIRQQTIQVQQIARDLSGLLESATISTANDDGIFALRAVLTLGE
jgi:hypothetical protein